MVILRIHRQAGVAAPPGGGRPSVVSSGADPQTNDAAATIATRRERRGADRHLISAEVHPSAAEDRSTSADWTRRPQPPSGTVQTRQPGPTATESWPPQGSEPDQWCSGLASDSRRAGERDFPRKPRCRPHLAPAVRRWPRLAPLLMSGVVKRARQDSNLQPSVPKTDALSDCATDAQQLWLRIRPLRARDKLCRHGRNQPAPAVRNRPIDRFLAGML